MELSTPVIQIWSDVLILPLIGAVDTRRAQQVVEQALTAVSEKGASVLIIDITGVPVVDTAVANHLVRTIDAVKLLGVSQDASRALGAAVGNLRSEGVNALIAGCTEVSLVFGRYGPDLPWLDPLQILAEALVREALGDDAGAEG